MIEFEPGELVSIDNGAFLRPLDRKSFSFRWAKAHETAIYLGNEKRTIVDVKRVLMRGTIMICNALNLKKLKTKRENE